MKYLKELVKEYKKTLEKESIYEEGILAEIKAYEKVLTAEKFLPSSSLKNLFAKLKRRSQYPMEVAIVGQFSSGKSTFLNALLAKDVLPTGITPVTSKVNFINYGPEYKLKVTYHNGAQEYHALEMISRFTDQRVGLENVKYLTLYAPSPLLQNISFVDTPGLNSLSLEDTQTTKKILRDVDGIIWVSLIDNAGKQSEVEVLDEYISCFKDKSLCVLNQKDKFSSEEVEKSLAYMRENFSNFFTKVISISAQQALDARSQQKEVLEANALASLQNQFKTLSVKNKEAVDLSFFTHEFETFKVNMAEIEKNRSTNNTSLMKASNIQEVLDFIETNISKTAKDSKAYALRSDLKQMAEILILEYKSILGIYESLEEILVQKEEEILTAFDDVYLKHSPSLDETNDKIEDLLIFVSEVIQKNIIKVKQTRYEEKKSILGIKSMQKYEFDALTLDYEKIMQILFFDDQYMDKQIKSLVAFFKGIELQSSEDFLDVFSLLKNEVQVWQEAYEHVSKHREIASDEEFAQARQFVAKVYENILLSFSSGIEGNIRALHKKFSFFEGVVSSSYKEVVIENIYNLENRINKQIKLHKKEPLKYLIMKPSLETVLEQVKESFSFEKMEKFLSSRRNYLYKIIEKSKLHYQEVNKEKLVYLSHEKEKVREKITSIESLLN